MVSLFESFQNVTEGSRMVITVKHHIILNTFSRQSAKIILRDILCALNFCMHIFSNLPLPGQARFCCFPFFLIHKRLKYLYCNAMSFVYRVFFCLQSSVWKGWRHFSWLQVLFCLFYWEKLKICSSELHQFYLLEKPQNYSHLQKCSIIDGCNCYKCLHKIIALNQSAN